MKTVFSLALGCACLAFGQTPTPPARHWEFEVASVHPAAPPPATSLSNGGSLVMIRSGMRVNGNRVDYSNGSLHDIIRTAYRLKDFQISCPDWMTVTKFDIEATMPEGATKSDVPEMLQALLADRFKLTVHSDSKEHDVYALLADKDGARLQPTDPDAKSNFGGMMDGNGLSEAGQKKMGEIMSQARAESGQASGATTFAIGGSNGISKLNLRSQTLSRFADSISPYMDRPVIDMTGIEGEYDFTLEMSNADMMRRSGRGNSALQTAMAASGSGNEADTPGGSLPLSIRKYGLKLEKRKAPVEMLVIDHCEKTPTAN